MPEELKTTADDCNYVRAVLKSWPNQPHTRLERTMLAVLDDLAKLTRERDAAREALRKYGNHTADCTVYIENENECNCGVVNTLVAQAALAAETEEQSA